MSILKTLIACVALVSIAVTPVLAQEDTGDAFWTSIDGQRVLTEVIPVQGADPNELADLLNHFFGEGQEDAEPFHSFVIDSTRSIVVSCNPSTMKDVRIALRKLDRPRAHGATTETAILQCTHRRAQEIAESASVQLTNIGKLAVDAVRNTIVVRDSLSRVEAVRDLVKVLDRPAAKMIVEFHVLGPNGAPLANGGLGANLDRELVELGLTGYGIVSHTMVRTLEGEKYMVSEQNAFRNLTIRGKVKKNAASNDAEMEFQLQITQSEENNRNEVQLQTNLRLPLEERTIVGIAPTGQDGSRPLVLVVRVR